MSGSSPRTRGTHLAEVAAAGVERFIPAYTGNSLADLLARRGPAVHPRVHGELSSIFRLIVGSVGSSPRTRGTPVWGA